MVATVTPARTILERDPPPTPTAADGGSLSRYRIQLIQELEKKFQENISIGMGYKPDEFPINVPEFLNTNYPEWHKKPNSKKMALELTAAGVGYKGVLNPPTFEKECEIYSSTRAQLLAIPEEEVQKLWGHYNNYTGAFTSGKISVEEVLNGEKAKSTIQHARNTMEAIKGLKEHRLGATIGQALDKTANNIVPFYRDGKRGQYPWFLKWLHNNLVQRFWLQAKVLLTRCDQALRFVGLSPSTWYMRTANLIARKTPGTARQQFTDSVRAWQNNSIDLLRAHTSLVRENLALTNTMNKKTLPLVFDMMYLTGEFTFSSKNFSAEMVPSIYNVYPGDFSQVTENNNLASDNSHAANYAALYRMRQYTGARSSFINADNEISPSYRPYILDSLLHSEPANEVCKILVNAIARIPGANANSAVKNFLNDMTFYKEASGFIPTRINSYELIGVLSTWLQHHLNKTNLESVDDPLMQEHYNRRATDYTARDLTEVFRQLYLDTEQTETPLRHLFIFRSMWNIAQRFFRGVQSLFEGLPLGDDLRKARELETIMHNRVYHALVRYIKDSGAITATQLDPVPAQNATASLIDTMNTVQGLQNLMTEVDKKFYVNTTVANDFRKLLPDLPKNPITWSDILDKIHERIRAEREMYREHINTTVLPNLVHDIVLSWLKAGGAERVPVQVFKEYKYSEIFGFSKQYAEGLNTYNAFVRGQGPEPTDEKVKAIGTSGWLTFDGDPHGLFKNKTAKDGYFCNYMQVVQIEKLRALAQEIDGDATKLQKLRQNVYAMKYHSKKWDELSAEQHARITEKVNLNKEVPIEDILLNQGVYLINPKASQDLSLSKRLVISWQEKPVSAFEEEFKLLQKIDSTLTAENTPSISSIYNFNPDIPPTTGNDVSKFIGDLHASGQSSHLMQNTRPYEGYATEFASHASSLVAPGLMYILTHPTTGQPLITWKKLTSLEMDAHRRGQSEFYLAHSRDERINPVLGAINTFSKTEQRLQGVFRDISESLKQITPRDKERKYPDFRGRAIRATPMSRIFSWLSHALGWMTAMFVPRYGHVVNLFGQSTGDDRRQWMQEGEKEVAKIRLGRLANNTETDFVCKDILRAIYRELIHGSGKINDETFFKIVKDKKYDGMQDLAFHNRWLLMRNPTRHINVMIWDALRTEYQNQNDINVDPNTPLTAEQEEIARQYYLRVEDRIPSIPLDQATSDATRNRMKGYNNFQDHAQELMLRRATDKGNVFVSGTTAELALRRQYAGRS